MYTIQLTNGSQTQSSVWEWVVDTRQSNEMCRFDEVWLVRFGRAQCAWHLTWIMYFLIYVGIDSNVRSMKRKNPGFEMDFLEQKKATHSPHILYIFTERFESKWLEKRYENVIIGITLYVGWNGIRCSNFERSVLMSISRPTVCRCLWLMGNFIKEKPFPIN